MEQGTKFDKDKIRMDLLPFDVLTEIARVLTFGAKKYSPDNWKLVENPIERYQAAMLRHFAAYKNGETHDNESGFMHISAVVVNAIFLLWFELRKGHE